MPRYVVEHAYGESGENPPSVFTITVLRNKKRGNYGLLVTDIVGNPGKPISERWSLEFVNDLINRVAISQDIPLSSINTGSALIECCESKTGGHVSYFLIKLDSRNRTLRTVTTVEQIETMYDDDWDDITGEQTNETV